MGRRESEGKFQRREEDNKDTESIPEGIECVQ